MLTASSLNPVPQLRHEQVLVPLALVHRVKPSHLHGEIRCSDVCRIHLLGDQGLVPTKEGQQAQQDQH